MLFKIIGSIFVLLLIGCIIVVGIAGVDYITSPNEFNNWPIEGFRGNEVFQIDAKTLIESYDDNEMRFNSIYKDNIMIRIIGNVTDIDEDGDCFLDILGIENFTIELNDKIVCTFNKSEKYEVMNISKGDRIHIKGKFDSAAHLIITRIFISNCKIM